MSVSSKHPVAISMASPEAHCTTCGYDHECTPDSLVIVYAVIYRGRLYRLENPFKAYSKCRAYLNPKSIICPCLHVEAILFEKLLLARLADVIKEQEQHVQRRLYGLWPRWWRTHAIKYARQRAEEEGKEILWKEGSKRYDLVWGRCALGWEADVGYAKEELWRPRIGRWWHGVVDVQVTMDQVEQRTSRGALGTRMRMRSASAESGSEGGNTSVDWPLPDSKEDSELPSTTCRTEDNYGCCRHDV